MPATPTAHPAVLPSTLRPSIDVALARASERIPQPRALPGGVQYEPKWDGFRLVIVRDEASTSLWSRQGKDLTAGFPDLAAAAAAGIPPGFVLDGEAVVWRAGRLDFDALQRRLTLRGAQLSRVVRTTPATFVAFDLLAAAGHDLRGEPLRTRRQLLEELSASWERTLQLSAASTDPAQAREWFDVLPELGIEGVVAKGHAQTYDGGQRSWVKVKHRDTVEVVCGAVTGTLDRPEQLVVGLPVAGVLRIVGRSTPLDALAARGLSGRLRPPIGPHPWPVILPPTAFDRFTGGREPTRLALVDPFVVEVSADSALLGHSFRHAVRFVRTRPELAPADVASHAEAGGSGHDAGSPPVAVPAAG